MNAFTKTNIFGRPRLLNWMTTGLLTGWVMILAVLVEVNGVAADANIHRSINSTESVQQKVGEQFCSIRTRLMRFG